MPYVIEYVVLEANASMQCFLPSNLLTQFEPNRSTAWNKKTTSCLFVIAHFMPVPGLLPSIMVQMNQMFTFSTEPKCNLKMRS